MRSLALLSLALTQVTSGHYIQQRQHEVSLDELIKAQGKEYFGVASEQQLLESDNNADIITANFGQVTAENSMKWESLNPEPGTYSWDQADYLVDWAVENNQMIRGHTLVWHSQLASWVESITDPAELTQVIEEHVATVMGRWAGQITHWDVVNEMFDEDGSLRDSVFSNVLGEDFVGIAFNAARQADPDCKLYINDYNLDEADYAKTQGMATKVSEWLEAGIPIDGIGSQGHLKAGMGAGYGEALNVLADSGVSEIAVTELDIEGASAEDYVNAVNGCMNQPKCVGVTVWGVSDPDSWRAENNPLLFGQDREPKEAYDALVEALQ